MFLFINSVLVSAAFVCLAFSLVGASDEDDHSRFSYDHQMLDKIVKVEQKVDQMDKKLEASLENFLAILQYRKDEMQTQGDSLTGNLTEFKKEIQAILQNRKEEMQTLGKSLSDNFTEFRKEMQAILQYRKEEIQTLGKSMSDNFTEFRKEIQAILKYREDEMKTLGERLSNNLTEFRKEMQEMYGVPKIAFRATYPSISTYSANQVLILRDSVLNEGSGYNGTTGEFTAPVAGLYLFSAHMCPYAGKWAVFAIVVGIKEVAVSAHTDETYVCSSVSAVTNVQNGEKVFLKAKYETKLQTDDHRQSSFNGVRISN